MPNQTTTKEPLVLVSKQAGVTVIPSETLLKRLNYFDGKFLRAEDLRAEQQYLRQLVQLSNQAGGHGVAHGYTVTLGSGGDTLNVGPGLAIDPAGRVLLLPQPVSIGVQQLIDQSKELLKIVEAMRAAAGGGAFSDCEFVTGEQPSHVPQAGDLYLVTVSHAEAFCGQADVFGKLCEDACVTSTDRPFVVEGVVLRAIPLLLRTPLAQPSNVILGQAHMRSRVASAYFNDERLLTPSLVGKAGLASAVWCFGAEPAAGSDVPIAVIARAGQTTLFLDAWTARRERIDPQARRYWQWRMRMRPWDVFLAQVLQFQCQLSDLFKAAPDPGSDDPCLNERQVIAEAAGLVAELNAYFADVSAKLAALDLPDPNAVKAALGLTQENFSKYADLQKKLDTAREADFTGKLDRVLINGGIVELPSGGYLPVAPSSTVPVNRQVRALLGEGVDLRFCVVRPDYPAHALEEVQHMERISLLEGIDDPARKPEVDILVPDGEILAGPKAAGGGLEAGIKFLPHFFSALFGVVAADSVAARALNHMSTSFLGAARGELLPGGGRSLRASLLLDSFQRESDLDSGAPAGGFTNTEAGAADSSSAVTETAAAAGAETGGASGAAAEKQRLLLRLKEAMSARRGRQQAGSSQKATATVTTTAVPPGVQGGIWLDMSCDKDPATLKAGDVLKAEGRVALAGTADTNDEVVSGYFDTRMHADVLVNGVENLNGGGKLLRCGVSLTGSVITKFGGNDKDSDARLVNLDAELRWEPPGTLKLHAKNLGGDGQGSCEITWGGSPRTFDALVRNEFDDDGDLETNDLVEGNFVSNPAVLEASNPSHGKAVTALQVVGTALNDPAFAGRSAALLFPAPPQAEEVTVLARHDWVLFHRRRTRTCGVEAPPPPPAATTTRRYNVYLARETEMDDVQRKIKVIHASFLKMGAKMLEGLDLVDVAEFQAGSSSLASDATALLSKWQAAHPLGQIFYGLIASSGEAVQEGEALANGRLGSVRQVVTAATALHPKAVFDVFPFVPAPLASPGFDGLMVFVLVAQTVRHAVYRVGFPGGIGVIRDAMQSGKPLDEDIIHRAEGEKVGEVNFLQSKPPTVPDNSLDILAGKWAAKGGKAGASITVRRKSGLDTEQQALGQFVDVIAGKLGKGPGFNPDLVTTQHEIPNGCEFASFIDPDRSNM